MPSSMSALSLAIRSLRKRLGKTMVQFADMIGCKQSTISRYESGKLVPGRTVLILLLRYAHASERQPILDALGVSCTAAQGWDQRELVDALKTFQDYLEVSAAARSRSAPRLGSAPALLAFAKAARQIVSQRSDVEPALVAILRHWIEHSRNRRAHEYFRHVAAYLDVELKVLQARRPKRRP
jgi:DNA-binding XRE family transcriptional regulator